MEHQQEDQQNRPVPCLGGCGFYGNPLTGGLCSKCSRAQQAKKTDEQGAVAPTSPQHSTSAAGEASSSASQSTPGKATASTDQAMSASASDLMPPSISPSPTTQEPPAEGATMSDTSDPSSANATDASGPSPTVDETSSIASPQSNSAAASSPTTPPTTTPAVAEGSSDTTAPTRPVQTKLNRCWTCNSKVGMLGFSCRCGYTYCGSHRYADAHDCDFEWKAFERKKLRDENPDATAEKIQKI